MTVKYIFVTGGVVSSLGKGLTAASIGMLLEARGFRIRMLKIDPYINVDPGTMSPYQHGEVYVTKDGGEADLDLGHYERFTQSVINRDSNFTTGAVYSSVIQRERAGDYLGQTVQVVPHIIEEIKNRILKLDDGTVDFVIAEVGGTVGDIESLPFLEAIRQFPHKLGRDHVMYIHLTYIPYLRASGELKTKPTQHSVGRLREIGIQPHIIICRCEKSLSGDLMEKIALFCNVGAEDVIEEKDVDHSIYEVPLMLEKQHAVERVCRHFGLPDKAPQVDAWRAMVDSVIHPEREVEVVLVGKYIELTDAYKSIYEAITHGGIANRARVTVRKVHSEKVNEANVAELLKGASGILVAPGFGSRGIEGKIAAVRHARENKIPFFGICLGMQCAVIEFARNVCGMKGANSTEFDKNTPYPVISLLEEQKKVTMMGGSMRLGSYTAKVVKPSYAFDAYQSDTVSERHRHRYEFNNEYKAALAKQGMRAVVVYEQGDLAEAVQIDQHPWFLGTQYHPEFQSKPTKAGPLFAAWVKASLEYAKQSR